MPLMVPPNVAVLPLVLNVPPLELSVTSRFKVKPASKRSVPPPKVSSTEAAPRLASLLTASVPALIVVPPA